MYAEQHVKLTLECGVNINFSSSVWLKNGQIVQTILKDNINNKRVSGHRFLVEKGGNLLIDNVRLEDDGRWQCEAEDPLGFVVTGRPVQLTVLGKFISPLICTYVMVGTIFAVNPPNCSNTIKEILIFL